MPRNCRIFSEEERARAIEASKLRFLIDGDEIRSKISKAMTKYLSSLTKEERRKRMQAAFEKSARMKAERARDKIWEELLEPILDD